MTIPLTLEIGSLTETVVVTSSAELINTETATVASTLNSDQLTRMPTPTRNALNAITFLPGVNTPGANRDSTINGLPEGFLSITLDGVSNNDNFLRNTDGFFASVTPRQDAVEAVSVTLAAAGATVGRRGRGAVTMAFQTRSGGNRFTGSAYEYLPRPDAEHQLLLQQDQQPAEERGQAEPVRRARRRPDHDPGPLRRPEQGVLLRPLRADPLPEQLHAHAHRSTTRRPPTAGSATSAAPATCEVNLLQLAAANGQISAKDPTMAYILGKINDAAATQGTRSPNDPLFDSYVWQSPSELFEHQPTVRIDYNLTNNHRLSGSFSFITAKRTPDYLNSADPRFPDAPNHRDFVSTRPLHVADDAIDAVEEHDERAARRPHGVLRRLAVRLARRASTRATRRVTSRTRAGSRSSRPSTTDWYTSQRSQLARRADLQHRRHAHVGEGQPHDELRRQLPDLERRVRRPADGAVRSTWASTRRSIRRSAMFNTTNIPGAVSDDLTNARNLYAVLTGRVTSINSAAVINPDTGKYEELGPTIYPGGIKQLGLLRAGFLESRRRP